MMEEANQEVFALSGEEAFSLREYQVETRSGRAMIQYIVCEPLEEAGFLNAFSTRVGGVSPLPEHSLNLTHFKGDTPENVGENRRRFLEAIGGETMPLITMRQTHSTERCVIESAEAAWASPPAGDALITRLRNVLLAVQTADCLPILIADPKTKMMAAIHAGWRGTAGRIVERTIADLMRLGVNPRTCLVALGPCASAARYEVGGDVIDQIKREFGYWKKILVNFRDDGKCYFDNRAATLQQLRLCGFDEEQIFVAPYCTMLQNELFFSYRLEAGGQPLKAGRLLSVIGRKSA
jgi:YfiH family protein